MIGFRKLIVWAQRRVTPIRICVSAGLQYEAVATCATFLHALATQHFFFMLQRLGDQNIACLHSVRRKFVGFQFLQSSELIDYFVGAPFSLNCPCMINLALFSARQTIALFNQEITVSLKNKRRTGLQSVMKNSNL